MLLLLGELEQLYHKGVKVSGVGLYVGYGGELLVFRMLKKLPHQHAEHNTSIKSITITITITITIVVKKIYHSFSVLGTILRLLQFTHVSPAVGTIIKIMIENLNDNNQKS